MCARSASPLRRVHWVFWGLLGLAVLAAGSLSSALTSSPGPVTGLRVVVSGLVLVVVLVPLARIMAAAERVRRRSRR